MTHQKVGSTQNQRQFPDSIYIVTGRDDRNGFELCVTGEHHPRIRINNRGIFIGDGKSSPHALDRDLASKDELQDAIDLLVAASPASLNTLNELANAMGDDPNFLASVTALINNEAASRAYADNVLETAIQDVEDDLAEYKATPGNIVVSKTNPGLTEPGLWIELNPDNSVKTFWIENGI